MAITEQTQAIDRDIALLERAAEVAAAMRVEVEKRIVGQREVIDEMLVALLANGHALLVGVPGLAKTLLVQTVADALDLEFSRIQFTPDLMPTDITGTEVIEEDRTTGRRVFRFVKGPVFANIVLADEINRTPPKTQAALLEAMQERAVTAAGETYTLPKPFFVLATQNPIEQEGTYPLPEAQLDRFAMKLRIGYPNRNSELEMLAANVGATDTALAVATEVVNPQQLSELQNHVAEIEVSAAVQEYLVDLGRVTRERREVSLGLSPRGLITWQRVAQARAHLRGRDFVTPDDIQDVALPVLSVRLSGEFDSVNHTVDEILKSVAIPNP